MKKFLLITASLLTALILVQGCVPAAFVAGATAGSAVVYDKRDMQTMFHDRETAFDIATDIRQDESLQHNTHISVFVFDHIALLVGQTATAKQRNRVEKITQSLPYIKRTYNKITVRPITNAVTRSNDTWITTKVKTRMLAEKGLHASQLKVVTENRVVYLMGLVNHRQATLATSTASRVTGVKKVVKLFEYM